MKPEFSEPRSISRPSVKEVTRTANEPMFNISCIAPDPDSDLYEFRFRVLYDTGKGFIEVADHYAYKVNNGKAAFTTDIQATAEFLSGLVHDSVITVRDESFALYGYIPKPDKVEFKRWIVDIIRKYPPAYREATTA